MARAPCRDCLPYGATGLCEESIPCRTILCRLVPYLGDTTGNRPRKKGMKIVQKIEGSKKRGLLRRAIVNVWRCAELVQQREKKHRCKE